MTVTAEDFETKTGLPPEQDDLERSNCPRAGSLGHDYCGWCRRCDVPVFQCGHRMREE